MPPIPLVRRRPSWNQEVWRCASWVGYHGPMGRGWNIKVGGHGLSREVTVTDTSVPPACPVIVAWQCDSDGGLLLSTLTMQGLYSVEKAVSVSRALGVAIEATMDGNRETVAPLLLARQVVEEFGAILEQDRMYDGMDGDEGLGF